MIPTSAQQLAQPVEKCNTKARYIMVGGFLGAGKTTAVARLARHLHRQGLRVGLITNDQGSGLVDTELQTARGFPTEEIAGGCFCCRFNSLMDAAQKLSSANKPDVFLAEPVGSCTDLVATVTYPLRRIYGEQFSIAPMSVLVDPIRAMRVFGLEPGGNFSPKVAYIYRKQLEEADIIVINKTDLLEPSRRSLLRQFLEREFPRATFFEVSARNEQGLAPWFDCISASEQQARATMEVDYNTYAEGEALLGWLNATLQVRSGGPIDANEFVAELARRLQGQLLAENAEIAHLKMTFSPDEGLDGLAAVSLVQNDFVPELSLYLEGEVCSGQLILNLRAEGVPTTLQSAVENAFKEVVNSRAGVVMSLEHFEVFQPGKPLPTHRDTSG